jgi:hypothetical protein
LALPALGLLTIALALGFGGGTRPVRWAMVYGGPTDQRGPWHGRVAVFETSLTEDMSTPLAMHAIEVVRRWGTREHRVDARTGPDGWVDVTLPSFDVAELDLVVSDGASPSTLAAGRPKFPLARWRAAIRRGIDQRVSELFWGVQIEQAVLVPSFWSKIVLPGCRGAAEVRAFGGQIAKSPTEPTADPSVIHRVSEPNQDAKPLEFWGRADGHVFELNVACSEIEGAKTFHLPVVPGAFSPLRIGETVEVRSARGLTNAYYTWVTEGGRGESGRVELRTSERGVTEGRLSLPVDREGLYLVLSSSPDGRSPSTVGFPLDGQRQTWDALDGFLLDGSEEAKQREYARVRRLKRVLLGYVAALFSLAWVLFRAAIRASDRKLIEGLERQGADRALVGPLARTPLLVAGILVALGLSSVVLWVAL